MDAKYKFNIFRLVADSTLRKAKNPYYCKIPKQEQSVMEMKPNV